MGTTLVVPDYRETAAATLERVPRCLAEGRFVELKALLTPDIRLRALIPPGPEHREGSEAVVQCLQDWFGGEPIHVDDIAVERFADRWLLAYRFTIGEGALRQQVAQQCVCDVEDSRISAIDLVCSGFRPQPSPGGDAVRRFDAGDLGCADGLAQEFRRQIMATSVGSVLEVLTRDPAAREDLPPLARLMGNIVRNVETLPDRRVAVSVERSR